MRLGLGLGLPFANPLGNALLVGLGGAWRLDGDLTDSSGNGRTLTGTGDSYTSSGLFAVKNSALIGGRGDTTWGGTAGLNLGNTDLTVCAWFSANTPNSVNVATYVGWAGILQMYPASTNDGAGECGVGVAVDGGAISDGANNVVPLRVPTHFALTWDHLTGGWALYKGGVSLRTGTVTPSNLNALSTANFEITADPTASNKFATDMTLAYTRKLSTSEIATVATAATCDPTV